MKQKRHGPESVTYRDVDINPVALAGIEMAAGSIGQFPRQLGVNHFDSRPWPPAAGIRRPHTIPGL
ncbi:hypothetical protein GGC64_006199 [Mycobacterium sp. OAS707]|uniref:hypothetical protein n=1 Tax=Mycobacterium sp. OAS707 TaxID=2663822 RepID=UPI00178A0B28|nr:hypothetical protein [Mycobacterium sp. OAS707]MBE1552112.1 hypothetical protein [Mycobacterium sp. OAS707]